jgi:hypothetical protein
MSFNHLGLRSGFRSQSQNPLCADKEVSGYTKRTGSTSAIAFVATKGLQNQGFDHLIRHIVKRAFR